MARESTPLRAALALVLLAARASAYTYDYNDSSDSARVGLAVGYIVIIVIGSIVPLLCAIGLCVFLCKRKRRNEANARNAALNRVNNPYNPTMTHNQPMAMQYQTPYNNAAPIQASQYPPQYPPPRNSYEPVSLSAGHNTNYYQNSNNSLSKPPVQNANYGY